MKTQTKPKNGGQILLIAHEDILPNPYQPRKRFTCEELEGLAESIRNNGILQPVNVRKRDDGKYELISGERRLRAARMIGLARIPCILMQASEEKSAVYSLLENLQRQDLSFFEEADAIEKLQKEFSLPRDIIAQKLGTAQSTISNKLRLLNLPEDARLIINKEGLTERHARALLKFENPEHLYRALSIIVDRRLNVAESERLISQMLENKIKARNVPKKAFKDIRLFLNTLNHAVDTMRRAGIDADSARSETEEYIEYVVRIPKQKEPIVRAKQSSA